MYMYGDAMDYVNLKLLSVYYSVQKILRENLACPMAREIKPIIAIVKDDFELLTSKVQPHIKEGSNPEKMNAHFESMFKKIDAGQIKPERFLGHEFSADQTVEQMQIHDSFMALYDAFFQQFDNGTESIKAVKQDLLADIKGLDIRKDEYWMFKEMLTSEEQRSPITLDIEGLRDVVDAMYEVSCNIHGPVLTDKMLSQAVKESSQRVPGFRTDNFL